MHFSFSMTLSNVKSLPVVSNVTGDVEEQQVEEESLEDLFPDQAELEEDPLDQALEEEGRELAKERAASKRVSRCETIFSLSPHVKSTWDGAALKKINCARIRLILGPCLCLILNAGLIFELLAYFIFVTGTKSKGRKTCSFHRKRESANIPKRDKFFGSCKIFIR